jgi:DNA-binding LacI/PurR family transcriptional regulator
MHRKVDGLLVISLSPDDTFALHFKELGMPVVLIDAYSPHLTSLLVDNIEGAYHAVKYLIELGHRRIGFINGIKEGDFKFNQPNDRLIGFHRALGEAGILFEPELIVNTEWGRQGGKEAALQLLSREDHPTAIFAASDTIAVGVLEAAKYLGITVPAELSVIGFDGIELSELLELTTVQQPMMQMGELSVSKLVEQIECPQRPPELVRLQTTLIKRNTTARTRST